MNYVIAITPFSASPVTGCQELLPMYPGSRTRQAKHELRLSLLVRGDGQLCGVVMAG